MGGYGSGGHRRGRVRVTVESCFRFDAKMLRNLLNAREGAPRSASWAWSDQRGETAHARADYHAGDPFFMLRFMRDGETETQQIAISFSPCHFGGRRVWLHCGMCKRRAFRLFLYTHLYAGEKRVNRFFCRACMGAGLSYRLRNTKDLLTIGQTRAARVKHKLIARGARAGGNWWDFPDAPKGMRTRTYLRLLEQFRAACELADVGMLASAMRRFPDAFAHFKPGTQRGAA